MNNQGTLMAQDAQIARRELIRQNCARLGVTCAQLARPSTSIYTELSTPYDRILVDAPCTNTGVMRRRVDLRWRLRAEEITRMAAAQGELLRDAATQLKPGGVLVYSTCSLEPEENQAVVQTLLAGQPALRLERERQLTPFADGVDGAYVARLTRTA
jgi:16S rRNA (cytosine967-C5)-methyltransferase